MSSLKGRAGEEPPCLLLPFDLAANSTELPFSFDVSACSLFSRRGPVAARLLLAWSCWGHKPAPQQLLGASQAWEPRG